MLLIWKPQSEYYFQIKKYNIQKFSNCSFSEEVEILLKVIEDFIFLSVKSDKILL